MKVDDVVRVGLDVHPGMWREFSPIEPSGLRDLEHGLGITLPHEFAQFLLEVGCGHYPEGYGGRVDKPSEIVEGCGSAIYYFLGSMAPRREWATREQHRELWLTRGQVNPDAARFTEAVMTVEGLPLFDMLFVGHDGGGGYLVLHVGDGPRRGECWFAHGAEVQKVFPTFFHAIRDALLVLQELDEDWADY